MVAVDFNYNGIFASDFGVMICRFDSSGGVETVANGSPISFNTVSLQNGSRYALTSSTYDSSAEYTFQICKYDCESGVKTFDVEEQRNIARWLNRKNGFFPLKIIQDGYENIFFEGSFNISAIKLQGEVYGFELTFITNRPFALLEKNRFKFSITDLKKTYQLRDISDEIGYIYPTVKITCLENGNLTIHNSVEDRTTLIKNCVKNEVITVDENLNIKTSLGSHKIQNDFNFVYLRIANIYDNRNNALTFSLKCNVEIEYNPIVKGVGL